ncbi:hypothetical protein AVEN_2255-1 [Araneus ventricosus]|uniref:Uncharacterized protein n=1 Tax=Araneus ventricosus TaxID=182803 RepID=A0A4Y2NDP5_ARAVE|nr:hypothetical protein AVEN_2255-1 [Araneus ventricosus]
MNERRIMLDGSFFSPANVDLKAFVNSPALGQHTFQFVSRINLIFYNADDTFLIHDVKAQKILRESLKEVFVNEGHYSPEQFELYRVNVCDRPDEERKKVFNDLLALGGESCMVVCIDRSSELCKEFDYIIKKFGVYAKEITESEECRKNEEMIKKPGGHTMFG